VAGGSRPRQCRLSEEELPARRHRREKESLRNRRYAQTPGGATAHSG